MGIINVIFFERRVVSQAKKLINNPVNQLFGLIQMLAASYLPRRWPAKYFHRYESLRPCSGWERVVSSHLATSEFFEYAQNCIMIKANAITINNLTKKYCFTLRSHSLQFCFTKLSFVLLRATSSFVTSSLHSTQISFRKSPRPISNARLKMLPLLHLHPINVIIFNGTYQLML